MKPDLSGLLITAIGGCGPVDADTVDDDELAEGPTEVVGGDITLASGAWVTEVVVVELAEVLESCS